MTLAMPELDRKRLEVLRATVPSVSKIANLSPGGPEPLPGERYASRSPRISPIASSTRAMTARCSRVIGPLRRRRLSIARS